jgi:hypothetical protein
LESATRSRHQIEAQVEAGGAVMLRRQMVVVMVCTSMILGAGHAIAAPTKSPRLIDACTLVSPAEAGAALGGNYGKSATSKSLTKGWKPTKTIRGYGACELPYTDEETAFLDVQVWRYATTTAAARFFDRLVAGYEKDGVEVARVQGVGDVAAFTPAHPAPERGVTNPGFLAVAGRYLIMLGDARGDHTSPDGYKVADQTGESERLATLATTALGRLPQ